MENHSQSLPTMNKQINVYIATENWILFCVTNLERAIDREHSNSLSKQR